MPSAARAFNMVAPITNTNSIEFEFDSVEEAFPDCEPGLRPYGSNVLVQIRHPRNITKGGIILGDSSRSDQHYNTQAAKVISLGELCFKSVLAGPRAPDGRATEYVADWPSGAWFEPGDFVRVPKYAGDRFSVKCRHKVSMVNPETGKFEPVTVDDEIIFAVFKAREIIGVITGDVLKVRAFLD